MPIHMLPLVILGNAYPHAATGYTRECLSTCCHWLYWGMPIHMLSLVILGNAYPHAATGYTRECLSTCCHWLYWGMSTHMLCSMGSYPHTWSHCYLLIPLDRAICMVSLCLSICYNFKCIICIIMLLVFIIIY